MTIGDGRPAGWFTVYSAIAHHVVRRVPRQSNVAQPTTQRESWEYLFVYNLYRVLRVTDPFAVSATTGHKANPVDCKADGIPG
jgi:hypothetical protein